MPALMHRAGRRYFTRHRWQVALSLLGVALGVAVVVAVDLANQSARRAFTQSQQIVTGSATHQIVGGPSGVPQQVYRTLRLGLGVARSAPVITGQVRLPGTDQALQLTGIDAFADAAFHRYLGGGDTRLPIARLVAERETGVLSAETAHRLGVQAGDRLTVQAAGAPRQVRIIGLLRPEDPATSQAVASLLITDIATAQELLHMPGSISRIDLALPAGPAGTAELNRIRAALPPGVAVIGAAAHTQALEQMTRAFQSNLTALSLLALIVGMFLIYNTMTFSMVQRRRFIGLMRALGVTRREIFRMVMVEALFIGVAGTAAGMLAGVLLGHGLVHLVTRTINDLYFVIAVRDTALSAATVLLGTLLGVAGTLAAAVLPAVEATRAPPRAVLNRAEEEQRLRRRLPAAAAAGAALIAAGAIVLVLDRHSLPVSYGGVLFIIVGFAALTPALTLLCTAALQPLLRAVGGARGAMAARGVSASLSRTGVAIAALTVAIAATIGVGVMIASFRLTVESWLKSYLQADVYVTAGGDHQKLDPRTVTRLIHTPGVGAYSTGRFFQIEGRQGITEVMAMGLPPRAHAAFRFKEGDPARVWPAFERGAVIVSESYAYHRGVGPGDRVTLRTDTGPHAFPVAGVFYHYGSGEGAVFMSRSTYDRYWHDNAVTSLGLYAAAGTPVDILLARLRARAGEAADLTLRSNRALRRMSMQVFDRTFAITAVLRVLTITVAFIGILSALMAVQLERAREFAVLRAIGVTPRGIWGLVTSQTALMGTLAGVLALPLGVALAVILLREINRLSFGWTLPVHIQPAVLLEAVGFSVIAAVLAGLYPALRMAGTSPSGALREE